MGSVSSAKKNWKVTWKPYWIVNTCKKKRFRIEFHLVCKPIVQSYLEVKTKCSSTLALLESVNIFNCSKIEKHKKGRVCFLRGFEAFLEDFISHISDSNIVKSKPLLISKRKYAWKQKRTHDDWHDFHKNMSFFMHIGKNCTVKFFKSKYLKKFNNTIF